jgi:hypothetical protein
MRAWLLAIALLLVAGCGDSTATAAPLDVKAAQGCELSLQILQEAGKGSAGSVDKINAAEKKLQPIASDLLAGTAEAKAAGKPEPKWATLGANFDMEMADLNSNNLDSYTKDQDAITADCNKIPGVAKAVGGFTK